MFTKPSLVEQLMKPLAIWLSCKRRSKPLVIAIRLGQQAGESLVIPRKRESSQLDNPCGARQYLGFVRYAATLFCWIPAFAGMTKLSSKLVNPHADFMFQLSREEKAEVVANCDHLAKLKYSRTLPYAFTEHGALMLGNVLKFDRAVEVSLLVVRTFVQLLKIFSNNKELAAKLLELERKVSSHDQALAGLIDAIRQLMKQLVSVARPIGFTANIKGNRK